MPRFVPKFHVLESRITPSTGGNLGYYLEFLPKTAIQNAISQVLPSNVTRFDISFDDQAKDGPIAVGAFLQGMGDAILVVGLVDNRGNPIQSFSGDGVITFTFTNPLPGTAFQCKISSIETDTDGSILVAGYVEFGYYPGLQSYTFLAKLTPDGQLDPSFGDAGQVLIPTDFPYEPGDIAFLPDHSFVILGSTRNTSPFIFSVSQNVIHKYSADGRPDTSFGQGGRFHIGDGINFVARNISLQPGTGRILASLTTIKNDMSVVSVLGLTPDGQLDVTFGDQGMAWNEAIPTNQETMGFFVNEDGTFTLTGKLGDGTGRFHSWETKTIGLLVARFNADGTPDKTFGTNGYVAPELGRFIRLTESDLFQNYIRKTWINPIERMDVLGVSEGTNRSVIFYTAIQKTLSPLSKPGYFAVRIDANGMVDTTYGTSAEDLALSTGGLNKIDFNRLIDGPDEAPVLNFVPTSDMLLVGGPADGTMSFDTTSALTRLLGTTRFFPNSKASVRTVAADVNGDGIADLIGAEGAGGESRVFIVDGATRERLAELRPYENDYTGGVFVSAGDIDGDGMADVVVTPDRGGGPVVVIYDGEKLTAGLNNLAQISRFFGIEDAQFRGGARSSLGDVNGDGRADLLVSAGHLGGPRIALFDGSGIAENGAPPKLVNDFFAFESTVRNGSFVALGDVNGDGLADLFFGGGPGSGPRIRAFDAKTLLSSPTFRSLDELPNAQFANFFAGDDSNRGGIRLAIKSVNGLPALVVGSGENEPGRVQIFNATTLLSPSPIVPNSTFDAFDGAVLADGIFVG
jgi:uncharacterized delta-60 repeat protein